MDIQSIPLISVSYNSAELVDELLGSFRKHYRNPVTIIDGSSAEYVVAIAAVCGKYPEVIFIHFDYNIHHERSKQIIAAYNALNIPRY